MNEVKIGEIEVAVNHVTHTRTNHEEGGNWLLGSANVTWRGWCGGCERDYTITVPVGCWDDTDDDDAEWAAWHEGARVIERCLGGSGESDMRGTAVALAFRGESETLGACICQMLREAVTADDHCVYA